MMMWSHFVIAASLVAVVYGQPAPPVGPDNPNNSHTCENEEVRECKAMQTGSDYTTLEATGPGSWPRAGVCRVVSRESRLHMDPYVYTVELYNQASQYGIQYGHPGVAYNVIDVNNFDFVHFRSHMVHNGRCVQHGYVTSGVYHGTTEDHCTGAPVRGGTWIKVKIESSRGRASLYVNDVHLSEVDAHFPTRSQTGIIVPNGFGNVIRFRHSALNAL